MPRSRRFQGLVTRELGRPGKGETLEQLKGMAAFVMMTDLARGRAFMARIDRLIAARDHPGSEPKSDPES